jgi:hypothetical protein
MKASLLIEDAVGHPLPSRVVQAARATVKASPAG